MSPIGPRLARSWPRSLGLAMALGVIAWQGVNLALGPGLHEYLIADGIASLVLLVAAWRASEVGLFAGFAMLSGVLIAATTGKLVTGGGHLGTVAAALGLVPCLIGVVGLGRRLGRG